jgi:hypothetical protein
MELWDEVPFMSGCLSLLIFKRKEAVIAKEHRAGALGDVYPLAASIGSAD